MTDTNTPGERQWQPTMNLKWCWQGADCEAPAASTWSYGNEWRYKLKQEWRTETGESEWRNIPVD